MVSLRYSCVLPISCMFRSGYIKWKSVLYFLNIVDRSNYYVAWTQCLLNVSFFIGRNSLEPKGFVAHEWVWGQEAGRRDEAESEITSGWIHWSNQKPLLRYWVRFWLWHFNNDFWLDRSDKSLISPYILLLTEEKTKADQCWNWNSCNLMSSYYHTLESFKYGYTVNNEINR